MTIRTTSARQTQDFGKEFAKNLKNGGVVALYGDLGAGKTTLVQGIAKGLGIKKMLISPTFVLIRGYKLQVSSIQYPVSRYLYHVDLYRLQNIDEIKAIGIEELLSDPRSVLLIEWPEKIKKLLPKKHWSIKLETVSENKRQIIISNF